MTKQHDSIGILEANHVKHLIRLRHLVEHELVRSSIYENVIASDSSLRRWLNLLIELERVQVDDAKELALLEAFSDAHLDECKLGAEES